MTRRKTHPEFIEEMKLKRPDIKVLGVYINNATKIKCQHNCKYQYVWMATPKHILIQSKCPKCSRMEVDKKNTKTTQEFIEELKIINPELTVIGEYINYKTKLKVKHICGYQWNSTPNSLIQGTYCPKCSFKKMTKSTEQFIEELKIINPDLTVIGDYIGANIKIKVKHICGHQWNTIPSDLLQGKSCPKCFRFF